MFKLSKRSYTSLIGVDPRLVKVVERAIQLTEVDFVVLEGLRTVEKQKTLVASGASLTMKSKHIEGKAVDLGAWLEGSIRWNANLYHKINEAMTKAANELNVKIRWGGTFKVRRKGKLEPFFDGPHFELVD